MRTLKNRGTVLAVALAALALGGCANRHHVEVGAVPDDYRTNHPIIVSEAERTVDIPVASGDRELNYGARSAVRGFSQSYASNASGALRIMVPSGSVNGAAASLIAEDVRKELVASGVPANRIIKTPYHAGTVGDAAPIRLSFMAITAQVQETCGRWPEDMLASGNENKHYANFGCATQNNLAAQIANPMDLIAPRGTTPIDAERRQVVIDTYRAEGAGL